MLPGLPKVDGVPISNQVSPWFVVSKILPVLELIQRVIAIDRVDDNAGVTRERPLWVGGRQSLAGLEQSKGPGDTVDIDEFDVADALAGGPVLVKSAVALLVDCCTGSVKGDAARRVDLVRGSESGNAGAEGVVEVRPEGAPLSIAIGEQVGVGGLSADVLGASIEEGPCNLGCYGAWLDRTIVKLAEIEVAIAIDPGAGGAVLELPTVVSNVPAAVTRPL